MDDQDTHLSKMLPGFEKPPTIKNSPFAGLVETEEDAIEEDESEEDESDEGGVKKKALPAADIEFLRLLEQELAPPLPMLDEIVAFFRHYLVCSDHQLTLLALSGASTPGAMTPSRVICARALRMHGSSYLPPLTVCSRTETAFQTHSETINS
jgi:hypothetical protein